MQAFEPWLQRRRLTPDGALIERHWRRLLPMQRNGELLMLKAAMAAQEIAGSAFLAWYRGVGAVRVLARADDAVLLERAAGPRDLMAVARGR